MLLAVLFAPAMLFVADPLQRIVRRQLTRRQCARRGPFGWYEVGAGPLPLWSALVLPNPVLIALGAPHRWLRDRITRTRVPSPPWRPWPDGPPPAGVREPRRPGPTPPADQIALPEPRD
jgi:hypothetical protein